MRALALAVLAALVAAAPAAAAPRRARLVAFRSCTQLIHYGQRYGPPKSPLPVARGAPVPATPAPPTPAPGAADGSTGASTNVQEQGVDEPDLVKAAGDKLYVLAGGRLEVVDTGNGRPRVLGSLELPGGFGSALLVHGDRALVISERRGIVPVPLPAPRPPATVPPGTPQAAVVSVPAAPSAVLTEVDISDPAAPRIVHTLEVPGSVLSARLTGAVARVALQTLPSGGNPARAATWLPRGVLRRPHARRARARALVHCRAVRRAAGFPGTDVLTVLTIDLDRGLPAVDSDAVMTAGETVYGSPDNFYVAAARYTRAPATVIHRFAAAAGDSTAYAGSAEVAGSLLSQWSLSEHAGFLRVATTDGDAGGLVSVLDVARMAPVGRLAGLGPGERLQGVRFVGDIGFVVTFRQIDPLHVVDLSDPAHPALRGELQIPGYSTYLHPLGPGRLLGVGQDATPEGRLLGAQLSLFDVSDLAHPTRIAHRSLGEGTSTEVEWDHHAFFYDAGQQLVVLPVDNVADAFRLGAASIDPAGSIEHHGAAVRRTLLIGGRLYTVSDAGVMASALPTLAELGFARF